MARQEHERIESLAAHAVSALLLRVADFFDLFDLSFFVSGATTLAGLVFLLRRGEQALAAADLHAAKVAGVIVACYALGLVAFAIGRMLRPALAAVRRTFSAARKADDGARWYSRTEAMRGTLLTAFGVEGDYTLLWAQARQDPRLAPSMPLLLRYWVMAATYDGLLFSCLVWSAGFALRLQGVAGKARSPWLWAALAMLPLLYACAREAGRYAQYQVAELGATLRWARDNPPAP